MARDRKAYMKAYYQAHKKEYKAYYEDHKEEHNIDADSNHYEQIKHLLNDTVVLYGLD